MSLVVFVVVTFGAAGLAIALRARRPWGLTRPSLGWWRRSRRPSPSTRRRRWSSAAPVRDERLPPPLPDPRLVVALGLTVAGLASGTRRDAPAVTLTILGPAALTMAWWTRAWRSWPPRPAACSAC
jgi:hypothetical protein